MGYKTIAIAFLLTLFSCVKQTPDKTNEKDTPTVLTESESKNSYRFLSKRYGGNIIEKLYQEAIEKNEELKNLHTEINEITSDSLADKTDEYIKYHRINDEYWSSATNYAETLSDSLTKESVLAIFEKLHEKFDIRVSHHERKMDSIEILKTQLRDQVILMKLFITEPMISNYQRNELPDIEKLESIIKDYHTLIEQTEPYTKIEK